MWRPWLKFLKGALWPGFRGYQYQNAHCAADFPRAWEIDVAFDCQKAKGSGSGEEDDGSSAEEEPNFQTTSTKVAKDLLSPGFSDFLQFLELGCGGSPLQGYPAVIIILSSIPPSVRILPLLSFTDVDSNRILTLRRSYSTLNLECLPAHSSARSGPLSTVVLSVPSIAPPRLLLSLVLYLSAQAS